MGRMIDVDINVGDSKVQSGYLSGCRERLPSEQRAYRLGLWNRVPQRRVDGA